MKGEQKGTICSCHRKEHKNYFIHYSVPTRTGTNLQSAVSSNVVCRFKTLQIREGRTPDGSFMISRQTCIANTLPTRCETDLPHSSVKLRSWYLINAQFSTAPVHFEKFQSRAHQQKQIDQLDCRLGIGTERYRPLGNISVGPSLHGNSGFGTVISIAVVFVAVTATRRSSGSTRARSGTLPIGS